MMKILRSLIVVALMVALGAGVAYATAPKQMTYQIMVLDPQTGNIRANRDVKIRIEVRQGSETGSAVYGTDFNVHTDKTGVCNVILDIPDNVDWSTGNYFLTTLVDDELSGSSKLTSVPYAFHSNTACKADTATVANSVKDVISRAELLGNWQYSEKGSPTTATVTYTFNDDGTGALHKVYTFSDGTIDKTEDATYTWVVNQVGAIGIMYPGTSSDEKGDYTGNWIIYTLKLANGKMLIGGNDVSDGIWVKQ